jgi:membrane-bound lytic murein transglycosylase D
MVPDALDLKILAEWCGVTVDELRELNPDLRRTTTPMGGHELKVPMGTAVTVQRQLASAEPLYVHFDLHSVRRGESVSSIARKYRVSTADLRKANDLSTRARVRVGQVLMIPQHQPVGLPASASSASRSASLSASAARTAAPVTYRVQRGDTLFSIARRFDTTVDALKSLNRLRTNTIGIGDRLTVKR